MNFKLFQGYFVYFCGTFWLSHKNRCVKNLMKMSYVCWVLMFKRSNKCTEAQNTIFNKIFQKIFRSSLNIFKKNLVNFDENSKGYFYSLWIKLIFRLKFIWKFNINHRVEIFDLKFKAFLDQIIFKIFDYFWLPIYNKSRFSEHFWRYPTKNPKIISLLYLLQI